MPRIPRLIRRLTRLRPPERRSSSLPYRDYVVDAPGAAIGMQVNELRIPAMGERRDIALVATEELIRLFPSFEQLPHSAQLGARYAYVGHGGQFPLAGAPLDRTEVRFRLVALVNDVEFPPVLTLVAERDSHLPQGFRQVVTCWPEEGESHGAA